MPALYWGEPEATTYRHSSGGDLRCAGAEPDLTKYDLVFLLQYPVLLFESTYCHLHVNISLVLVSNTLFKTNNPTNVNKVNATQFCIKHGTATKAVVLLSCTSHYTSYSLQGNITAC